MPGDNDGGGGYRGPSGVGQDHRVGEETGSAAPAVRLCPFATRTGVGVNIRIPKRRLCGKGYHPKISDLCDPLIGLCRHGMANYQMPWVDSGSRPDLGWKNTGVAGKLGGSSRLVSGIC